MPLAVNYKAENSRFQCISVQFIDCWKGQSELAEQQMVLHVMKMRKKKRRRRLQLQIQTKTTETKKKNLRRRRRMMMKRMTMLLAVPTE